MEIDVPTNQQFGRDYLKKRLDCDLVGGSLKCKLHRSSSLSDPKAASPSRQHTARKAQRAVACAVPVLAEDLGIQCGGAPKGVHANPKVASQPSRFWVKLMGHVLSDDVTPAAAAVAGSAAPYSPIPALPSYREISSAVGA